ncbi:MAG TPA: hypothetical protein VN457_04455 [Chlamydiales bacterium]|nr:hypothetical protein [Chlamydiales bacterium]
MTKLADSSANTIDSLSFCLATSTFEKPETQKNSSKEDKAHAIATAIIPTETTIDSMPDVIKMMITSYIPKEKNLVPIIRKNSEQSVSEQILAIDPTLFSLHAEFVFHEVFVATDGDLFLLTKEAYERLTAYRSLVSHLDLDGVTLTRDKLRSIVEFFYIPKVTCEIGLVKWITHLKSLQLTLNDKSDSTSLWVEAINLHDEGKLPLEALNVTSYGEKTLITTEFARCNFASWKLKSFHLTINDLDANQFTLYDSLGLFQAVTHFAYDYAADTETYVNQALYRAIAASQVQFTHFVFRKEPMGTFNSFVDYELFARFQSCSLELFDSPSFPNSLTTPSEIAEKAGGKIENLTLHGYNFYDGTTPVANEFPSLKTLTLIDCCPNMQTAKRFQLTDVPHTTPEPHWAPKLESLVIRGKRPSRYFLYSTSQHHFLHSVMQRHLQPFPLLCHQINHPEFERRQHALYVPEHETTLTVTPHNVTFIDVLPTQIQAPIPEASTPSIFDRVCGSVSDLFGKIKSVFT